MEIRELKVTTFLLILYVKDVPCGEIGKGHEVAHRFHDVPTQIVESSKEYQRELRHSCNTSHSENSLCLSCCPFPDFVDLVMHLTDFTFQQIQLRLKIRKFLIANSV